MHSLSFAFLSRPLPPAAPLLSLFLSLSFSSRFRLSAQRSLHAQFGALYDQLRGRRFSDIQLSVQRDDISKWKGNVEIAGFSRFILSFTMPCTPGSILSPYFATSSPSIFVSLSLFFSSSALYPRRYTLYDETCARQEKYKERPYIRRERGTVDRLLRIR